MKKLLIPGLVCFTALAYSCGNSGETTPPANDTAHKPAEQPAPQPPQNSKTFTATFESAEMGDYPHLIFTDESGNEWDFGQGQNTLGDVKLYDDNFATLADMKGKKFTITWDSVMTEYMCCDGSTDLVKGKLPAITHIEPAH